MSKPVEVKDGKSAANFIFARSNKDSNMKAIETILSHKVFSVRAISDKHATDQ